MMTNGIFFSSESEVHLVHLKTVLFEKM